MAGVNDIRKTFLEYFAARDHAVVPSSPLVPRNDPTLMFTNAGMVQFKNVFTGQETRAYSRAASSQKCVRAGGKHNDLDNVGYTTRHHTFFEMLGNFSFGDYFKERAIELAWDLITREYAIDAKRLSVTVYHDDDDAYAIWRKLTGFGDDRIIRIASSDNFWAMGETGPCGPCSEIFFDHGDKVAGGPPGSPDADGDRYVEIWNLVFMQFEQRSKTERVPLPRPSIDTGMGLERIAAVLQGKHDNYDTDLFQKLIGAVRVEAQKAGAPASSATGDAARIAARVIADHLRASSFLIADGVLPSNEGRGYVLRRIMRRAMRYAHQMGCRDPLMYRLVPTLVSEMGEAFPELVRSQQLTIETLRLEETRFKRTLDTGLKLLAEASEELSEGEELPGDVAFKLYDTYGFPIDLTQDALRPRGVSVDEAGFTAAMDRQKAEARRAWKGSGEAATDAIWFDVRDDVGATEFLGYDTELAEGEIRTLIKDGKPVERLKAGETGELVVNQTPFYGESGGQVGDTGVIRGPGGAVFRVMDTQKKLGSLFVHVGTVETGELKTGAAVELTVDHVKRRAIRANHSATHLLHEALRQVLGTHVAQKGSLVSPDRLRFDFSHTKPMTAEEIERVEEIANAVVIENAPVETRLMAVEDAMKSGAMALFGEKYGDEVRVVSMGAEGARSGSLGWSVELCGGTHARRTGDIGVIKVTGESGSAAGVRRIEALTAAAARAHLSESDVRLRELAALLRSRPEDSVERLRTILEERKALERQVADAKRQLALGGGGQASATPVVEIAGTKLYKLAVEGVDMKDLKSMADEGRAQIGSGVVAIANASADGKLSIVVAVTKDLTERFSAVDLVREASEKSGGKGGGGRPDMAQAGGPDGTKALAALESIEAQLAAQAADA